MSKGAKSPKNYRDGRGARSVGNREKDKIKQLHAEVEASIESYEREATLNVKLQAENDRMRNYLTKLYEGDGNFEFDELEQALQKGGK